MKGLIKYTKDQQIKQDSLIYTLQNIKNLILQNRRIKNNQFHSIIPIQSNQSAIIETNSSKLIKMQSPTVPCPNPWSKPELSTLLCYKSSLYETEQQTITNSIYGNEENNINFYKITPKEDLPKNLQKMNFQSINAKQNNVGAFVKVNANASMKGNQGRIRGKGDTRENRIRKAMRDNGTIMLLSEIYNYLDQSMELEKNGEIKMQKEVAPLSNVINQLDQWEKTTAKKGTLQARFSKLRAPSSSFLQRRSSSHKKQFTIKKFKIGSNYKLQVQKSLQVISCSHNNEQNPMSRFSLIQNSSKLLKKQLEQTKQLVQKQLEQKLKKLSQSRKQHHRLYQQKLLLHVEQQQLDEQLAKEQLMQNNNFTYHIGQSNIKSVFEEKKSEIEKNQIKIMKLKKNIQFLEEEAVKNQEELKNIVVAERAYYEISLEKGIDCRDGLVWVIRRLGLGDGEIGTTKWPKYLDKRSKVYLVGKAKNQELLEGLLMEKRQFVKQIGKDGNQEFSGKRSSKRLMSRKSSIKCLTRIEPIDGIKQIVANQCQNEIPKRYSRSAKKITALRQQYLKNQNLFKLAQSRGGLKFGYNLNGLTGRQVYNAIGQKIKQVDFTKLKKQKNLQKSDKIFQYQAILRKIEDLHMQMQEQDIQHQNHLLSQYRDEKQLFFTLAAACFGIKRAYSLIIKNFSWKNTV